MALSNLLLAGLQIIAGGILLATGLGGGLGVKLLLSGALTLVSSLLNARTGTSGWKSSPTYGWDSLGNTVSEGAPIPIVYGEHLVKPAIISTNLKTGSKGEQVLYLLLLVCAGEIESIHSIRLDDTPLESFPSAVATTDRLGTSTQTAIPDFNQSGNAYDLNTALEHGGSGHTYEMQDTADELVLALAWEGGLYRLNDNGNVDDAAETLYVEYKAVGASDSTYKPLSPPTDEKAVWTMNEKKAGTWATWGKTTAAIRKQIRLRFDGKDGRLARGRYTIRIRSDSAAKTDRVRKATLKAAIEVTSDSRTYAGYALLGLKLPASDQLNGRIPQVTCVVKGRKVYDPRTGTTAWSQNPILCARDLMLDATHGLGEFVTSADLHDGVGESWRTAADACDVDTTPPGQTTAEDRYQLDYVVDTVATGGDHIQQILQTCRATCFMADGKIRIGRDATGASARSFEGRVSAAFTTRRNILDAGEGRSSLAVKPLDASARSTVVRLQYVDRNRGYEKRVVEIRDQFINVGAIAGGPFTVGEKIKGTTSKAIGRITLAAANGALYLTYTQDDGATVFQTGETITGLTSGASCTSSSAPYTPSPERVQEVQMFGVTRRSQAIREARYLLQRAQRTPVFVTFGVGPGDLDVIPGDVIDLSVDYPAWTAKAFTVLSCGFDADGVGVIEAREYDADVFVEHVDTTQVDTLYFLPGGAVPAGLTNAALPAPEGTTTPPPATTPAPTTPTVTYGTSFFGSNSKWKSTTTPIGIIR